MSDGDELVQIRLPRDDAPALSRRSFLEVMGAAVALAGLDGCGRDVPEKILPYSARPRDVQPGVPSYYATSMLIDGFATGLVVESHEGRPTKIEGNPEHPASLGATNLHHQASVLEVYDPDRAARVRQDADPSSWIALAEVLRRPREDRGAGLRLLLEPTTSPTVHALLDRVRLRHPRAKVAYFSSVPAIANTAAGTQLALGRPLVPQYDLRAADVIVSLDADLLGGMPFALRYARQWSSRRRVASARDAMNRLYAVECMPSTTGLMADHRLRRRSCEVAGVAAALAAALPGIAAPLASLPAAFVLSGECVRFVSALARDLARRPRGTTLVAVGERQPPAVHALGVAINAALGNFGRAVTFTAPPLPLDADQDLTALTHELAAGAVETLVILDGNPVYGAPADLELAGAMAHARERIYLGAYENETARACNWFAPAAHYLESWGDGLAYDGTLSLVQPLVRPLRGGKTPSQLLAMLAGERDPDGRALVRATHAGKLDWDAVLVRGFADGTALPRESVPPAIAAPDAIARAIAALGPVPPPSPGALEVNFAASPTLHDGRFSNNAWLLEQPEPATKLTWDNAVIVSPATATRLGLETQQLVELRASGRAVRGPIFVQPGHADDACTLWLGFGRSGAESLAAGRGFDAGRLRSTRALAFAPVELVKIPGTRELARTQLEHDAHDRPIALTATLAEYRRDPGFTAPFKAAEPSLMAPFPYEGLQWAMSIDLSICTGCSACMVACQAENNVAVVGKTNILKHRQMHWLRIDSYYRGPIDNPAVVHQPMMCQHCETAPCEYVCPVNATVHSPDGLNEMVYNRCVGTRFCSNNCPYKVRRFNWFNWTEREPGNQGTYQLVHNPEVTVRDRGVMEKCTYCVQRIRSTEIRARVEDRAVRPGEIVTACQQACPTGAIQFGSLSHPGTPMVAWREEARSYGALNQEGTRPRTMYLARIDNPNPELER